ncbi:MAG: formate dehydrogenase subunit gamma [Planctomycetes bacterium]|nr:formate dehydrogenase subunit gamma [Planctomycetota bacterium]
MPSTATNGAAPASPATPTQFAIVDASIARLGDLPGALLPILHDVQDQLGFVPEAADARIAAALNLSLAEVHGVVTFYHDFRRAPPGDHVLRICRAEACQAVGGERLEQHLAAHGLGAGATSADGRLTVEAVYCLGNCALGPSVQFDGELHGRVDERRLDQLLGAAGILPRGGCGCGRQGGCR